MVIQKIAPSQIEKNTEMIWRAARNVSENASVPCPQRCTMLPISLSLYTKFNRVNWFQTRIWKKIYRIQECWFECVNAHTYCIIWYIGIWVHNRSSQSHASQYGSSHIFSFKSIQVQCVRVEVCKCSLVWCVTHLVISVSLRITPLALKFNH